jgi:hypothetical protein
MSSISINSWGPGIIIGSFTGRTEVLPKTSPRPRSSLQADNKIVTLNHLSDERTRMLSQISY